ncbi:MAG: hypothetical protein HOE54_17285, partial [Gammaproteobacteria bacterium]|nr:hypothetical protein [Gammaproteobacteria bacterium]
MDSAASYTIAFLFAILVHGIVAALIATNWNQNLIKVADVKPYYIDATVIAENPYTARKDRESDHRKSQRDKKIRQHRLDEADFRKTQARWEEEKTQQKEDPAPQPVIETKPEPEKSVEEPKVDREAVRSSFEEELSFAVIDEKNARKAVTDDEKAMAYVAQIQREIIQNWSRPPSARNGMQAILRVHLVPTG